MVSKVSVSYAHYFLIFTVIYRCNAHPENLDAPGARQRTHEMTDFLIRTWDASILWTDFGIRADIVVCFPYVSKSFLLLIRRYSHLRMDFHVPTYTSY